MTTNAVNSHFHLRMTATERTTIEGIQADAYEAGIGASLNDVIRHMIRISQWNVPTTEADARGAIVAHWNECPDCDPQGKPACLDGLALQRGYARVAARAAVGRRFQNAP